MAKPPENGENGESLEYQYDPRFDWERETQDILDDLCKTADALLTQTQQTQSTPSVTASSEEKIDLKIDDNTENIDNKAVSNSLNENLTPSVPTLWEKIHRPLGLTCALSLPLLLIIWAYNNTLQTCENTGVIYKSKIICGDTPEKKDAIFEYIACDYIQTQQLDPSFVQTFSEFNPIKRDSVVAALEMHVQRDKFSFRKNVAIAYFNTATKFINQKQMDSACWAFSNAYQYFEKLDIKRINDTLQKMTQIALQTANICDAPIQINHPTTAENHANDPYNNKNTYKTPPPKSKPIKRALKSRIESRIDDAPIPPEILEKIRYEKQQKQAPY